MESAKAKNLNLGACHRVLIVEDNAINQTLTSIQLKTLGYTSDIANDGQEALQMLAKTKYSLILMDCQMPIMDGYKATREIRRLEACGAYGDRLPQGTTPTHTIIVAMTANLFQEDKKNCQAAGMDDYLSKPVFKHTLEAMLNKWLTSNPLS